MKSPAKPICKVDAGRTPDEKPRGQTNDERMGGFLKTGKGWRPENGRGRGDAEEARIDFRVGDAPPARIPRPACEVSIAFDVRPTFGRAKCASG
jgi:hypothetical protein